MHHLVRTVYFFWWILFIPFAGRKVTGRASPGISGAPTGPWQFVCYAITLTTSRSAFVVVMNGIESFQQFTRLPRWVPKLSLRATGPGFPCSEGKDEQDSPAKGFGTPNNKRTS